METLMQNKVLIIGAVAVAVIGVGIWFMMRKKKDPESAAPKDTVLEQRVQKIESFLTKATGTAAPPQQNIPQSGATTSEQEDDFDDDDEEISV